MRVRPPSDSAPEFTNMNICVRPYSGALSVGVKPTCAVPLVIVCLATHISGRFNAVAGNALTEA